MEYKRMEEEQGDGPAEQPPPYSPPPTGFNVPTQGPQVTCECCGFGISTANVTPTTRLVQCQTCSQHTAIGPPPPGKKYTRCVCKKLLHCSTTANKVRCPGCKTVLTVGFGGGATAMPANRITGIPANGMSRVVCAHCSQVMLFASRGIARCPHCRCVSSVGRESARMRCIIYFILAFIFLGGGIGVTVGTYAAASAHGGYYYVWSGSYISGFIWLLLGIRYAAIRISYPENHVGIQA